MKKKKAIVPGEDSNQHVNPQSDKSSLCTQLRDRDANFLHADNEDADQTEILYVLSQDGSLSKLCLNRNNICRTIQPPPPPPLNAGYRPNSFV